MKTRTETHIPAQNTQNAQKVTSAPIAQKINGLKQAINVSSQFDGQIGRISLHG